MSNTKSKSKSAELNEDELNDVTGGVGGDGSNAVRPGRTGGGPAPKPGKRGLGDRNSVSSPMNTDSAKNSPVKNRPSGGRSPLKGK